MSINASAAEMTEGCSTVGVDRAGFLDQGHKHGAITSRVNMDLCSDGETNVLRRAAKMACRQLERFRMVWLSPECRGRKCKKPTSILTNIKSWKPKGITGSGRCKTLTCGGTKNNKPGKGQGRHEQQMIATDPKRKPREGEKITGTNRREYSVKAGKNLVAAGLVQEIIRAAIQEKEQAGKGNQDRDRTNKKRKTMETTRDED